MWSNTVPNSLVYGINILSSKTLIEPIGEFPVFELCRFSSRSYRSLSNLSSSFASKGGRRKSCANHLASLPSNRSKILESIERATEFLPSNDIRIGY